ncbi:MAG: hypothetical protein JWM16_3851 [Verrucomicrobiales bacterium]|nr:hypothetical protein [Verrucomicrobiales bacterium]
MQPVYERADEASRVAICAAMHGIAFEAWIHRSIYDKSMLRELEVCIVPAVTQQSVKVEFVPGETPT